MTNEDLSEDRALLTVTVWRHEGEILGVSRWRRSLNDRTEEVIRIRGFDELLAVIAEQLRSLSTDDS
jgi:hypothetical protein